MTERQALESTYWDRYSVWRVSESKNPENRQTEQRDSLLCENLPCALSKGKSGEHGMSDSRGVTSSSYTLFCAPETPIVPGDRIAVRTAGGWELTLWAGEGFIYASSHAEVPLSAQKSV